MAVCAEGMPCWVDVTLADVEAGKRFYGGLFGWTFEDPGIDERARARWSGRAGGQATFVNALIDGKKVAALAPKLDGRMPTAWGVYFATDDAAALARKIRDAGGQMVTDPLPLPPLGTMAVAADPGGAVFGLWQAGSHAGFEKRDQPGCFCWTEVYARDKNRTDPFYETVFGFQGFDLDLDEPGQEFRMWSPAGAEPGPDTAIGGRSVMGDAFPVEMPDHFLVYFVVDDCDGAVSKAVELGGRVQADPFDTPYGRIAVLTDNQGATFAVLAEPAETAETADRAEAAEAAEVAESGEVAERPQPDRPRETGT
ncbi:VOC family protein [Streptomyces sp. ISL-96]|uniref:VOC family protein n=1 Tax=Streptomyces sp. ISL-96 TaxID=2819191 RepID=UPI001BE7322E|nr:VOC family protein [Streptomyces sp. ISL-96]MBT2488231.1 VOC family protein [Streptomyces sp. ISL-96]